MNKCEERYHTELLSEAKAWAERNSWAFNDKTAYHDTFPPDQVQMLKECYDPTSMTIRGTPDATAIHKSLKLTVKVEAKTCSDKPFFVEEGGRSIRKMRRNFGCEARPFFHHVCDHENFQDVCLYVVRHLEQLQENGSPGKWVPCRDYGFVVDSSVASLVSKVFVPERYHDEYEWYEKMAKKWVPQAAVAFGSSFSGGDDPFLVIPHRSLNFIDWKEWFKFLSKRQEQKPHPTAGCRNGSVSVRPGFLF